jgi:hypothetical protein
LLAVALGSPHARAADDAPTPQFSEEPPSRWYGWQTLATDGAAIGLISASLATADNNGRNSPSLALAWGALGAYALGAPVMHFVHENPGRGFASFGMRIGGPVVLGFTGALLENCRSGGHDLCGLGGALIGTGLGIIGAVAVDAAVFAYDDKPAENEAARRSFRIGFNPRGVVAFGNF